MSSIIVILLCWSSILPQSLVLCIPVIRNKNCTDLFIIRSDQRRNNVKFPFDILIQFNLLHEHMLTIFSILTHASLLACRLTKNPETFQSFDRKPVRNKVLKLQGASSVKLLSRVVIYHYLLQKIQTEVTILFADINESKIAHAGEI